MEYVHPHGVEIPALGFGTWQIKGDRCREAVADALDLGYRHLDTAQLYENEAAVGAAIEDADVPRDDVFLVTKLLRRNLAHDDVVRSTRESLERLGTHIDLLLIHAPSHSVPVEETIGAMNDLQADGDVGHIGVSNFSVAQLRDAIDASQNPILTNQVVYHPFRHQDDLHAFCVDEDVLLTAYSPLARGDVIGDAVLRGIGERHGKTDAQVALRWLLQQDMVAAIPKAASHDHRAENLDVFDFTLTADELDRISSLA